MEGQYNNIAIRGISTVVPSTIENNSIYSSILGERRVKKQIKLTGIEQRHLSNLNQTASDLCFDAAEKMLNHLKWNRDEIKIMLFITQGPDFKLPSTSFLLHKRLKLSHDCLVFDMNLGCSSFNVGTQTICSLLQTCEIGDKAILLLGETEVKIKSPYKNYKDNEIAHDMLFGSEGSCVAFEKVKNNSLIVMNKSDGQRYEAIIRKHGEFTNMDGEAVFSFALTDVADSVNHFIDEYGIDTSNTLVVFHQAQKLILDNLIASCNIPAENEYRSLDRYGNTSGGSIPLTICANIDKVRTRATDKYLLCGFGVGLSWGCVYTSIPAENILPITESDDYYEDRPSNKSLANMNILIYGADSELGAWISKYIYDCGANLILSGKEISYLQSVATGMKRTTHCIGNNSITDLSLYLSDHELSIDGIVYIDTITYNTLNDLANQIHSKKNCKLPIVFVGDTSVSNGMLPATDYISSFFEYININNLELRPNGVTYLSTDIKIHPFEDNVQKWIEEYIANNCPEEWTKASYISAAIAYLLSEKGQFTYNSIINIA